LILTAITAGASRVASAPLCLHAIATTPAGSMELIRSLLLHRLRPSPHYSWVGSCITFFEACSAFTRVTTCRLAKSPYATFYTGCSDGFVVSTAAPIATGWSDPVPGRVLPPAVDQRLFTAHCNGLAARRTAHRIHQASRGFASVLMSLVEHAGADATSDSALGALQRNGFGTGNSLLAPSRGKGFYRTPTLETAKPISTNRRGPET
jgi:hypothetical protein